MMISILSCLLSTSATNTSSTSFGEMSPMKCAPSCLSITYTMAPWKRNSSAMHRPMPLASPIRHRRRGIHRLRVSKHLQALLCREITHCNVLIIDVLIKSKHFPELSTKCFVLHYESMNYVNSHCNLQNCKKNNFVPPLCPRHSRGLFFVPFMSLEHFGGQKWPF